jgi:uncharacterized protein
VTKAAVTGSPWVFFLLVLVLSTPFYVLGVAGGRLPGLLFLPISALMAVVPSVAALILVCRQGGARGAIVLMQRVTTFSASTRARWYLVALLIMPAASIVEFGLLRITGTEVPFPHFTLGAMLFYSAVFFVAAIGEELGWQGYAYPALRSRHSATASALILGVIWALWHVIPFIEVGRSAEWIVWHSLCAVMLRIIIVWLFENGGRSIFVAMLFHTMINLSWTLFPVAGSYYDPLIAFIVLSLSIGLVFIASKLVRAKQAGASVWNFPS